MATQNWHMRYTGHLGLRAPNAPLFQHSAHSTDPVDQIRFIADLGFAGVQDNFLKLRPVAQQRRIGAELARRGLAMGSFTNNPAHWNRPLWNSGDREARALLRRDLDASIAAAQRVDGHIATCVTAIDPDKPRRIQIEHMIENLKQLADRAARAGIALCVEPVAGQWIPGMLIDHIADAIAVVRAVDHPAVRLLFDFGHVQTSDGEVLTRFHECAEFIGAIQVADTPGRTDLGAGELDWYSILKAIRARGWPGLIEIVHMPAECSALGEQKLLERLRIIDDAL